MALQKERPGARRKKKATFQCAFSLFRLKNMVILNKRNKGYVPNLDLGHNLYFF